MFLGAERSYRKRHIVSSLGDVRYRFLDGMQLTLPEASQLVDSYVKRGIAASNDAKRPARLAARLVAEPIAVACCKILNDLRPLDVIIDSTYQAAAPVDRDRYLMAALAQVCFSGGVRYEILHSRTGGQGWRSQFQSSHPLPLDYYDQEQDFVIPLNATLAERTLSRAPVVDVAKAFVNLALGIAPRVNRSTIMKRAPEARLARRLFDFEDVISRYLHEGAGSYYTDVQAAWQWNSRYWEQVALYNLALYRQRHDPHLLQQAVQHAKHAVAIEEHPFTLTTLGKVLLSQIKPGYDQGKPIYTEAFAVLVRAIDAERRRGRSSVHAYVTLFRGSSEYLLRGGELSATQIEKLNALTVDASAYFPRDIELRDASRLIEDSLTRLHKNSR